MVVERETQARVAKLPLKYRPTSRKRHKASASFVRSLEALLVHCSASKLRLYYTAYTNTRSIGEAATHAMA